MVKISQFDVIDFYLKNFDEHLTISKPTILAKNIIFGGFYIDFDGTIACVSNKNNVQVTLQFFEKKGNTNSYIKGEARDSEGKLKFKIEGSWLTQIRIIDVVKN